MRSLLSALLRSEGEGDEATLCSGILHPESLPSLCSLLPEACGA